LCKNNYYYHCSDNHHSIAYFSAAPSSFLAKKNPPISKKRTKGLNLPLAHAIKTSLHIDNIPVISYNIDMYSTKEAAEKLRLSHDHVRLLARKGVIKAKKPGHDWVVLNLNYTRKRKPKGGKK
jgi:excisionase family DNA binding protein